MPLLPIVSTLDEGSPRAAQPEDCGVQLRPHQLTMLWRCLELETGDVPLASFPALVNSIATSDGQPARGFVRTMMGVMGDKVGSGKSFVILALVDAGRAITPHVNPVVESFVHNRIIMSMDVTPSPDQLDMTLLVIPHNLCSQWDTYIKRYGRGLRTFTVNRACHLRALSAGGDAQAAGASSAASASRCVRMEDLDLLVVTSTFYGSVVKDIGKRGLRRVVYDEADSLTLPASMSVHAGFVWFVTASYLNMLHPWGMGEVLSDAVTYQYGRRATAGLRSSGHVKSTFVALQQSTLSIAVGHALVVRNSDAYVDSSLTLPEPQVEIVECRASHALRVLSGIDGLGSIISCLNANDVESAMAHISSSNRTSEDNVVAALMEKLRREAHNLEQRVVQQGALEFATEEEREASTARLVKKRDDVRRRLELVRDRVSQSDMCTVCYDALANKTVVPCCSNSFCFACITRWLDHSRVCPLCKAPLAVPDLLVVRQPPEDAPGDAAPPAPPAREQMDKLQALAAIIADRCDVPGRSKVLIFSSFDNTFTEIAALLDRQRVRYRFLKGNNVTIAAIERDYRGGTLDVLLCNTNHYGSGLNFENTTDIVILHKFDTDIEHQVIGRAQRCGRTAPLRVWYLLHQNEMQAFPGAARPQNLDQN
jgi:hypothetical protein